MGHKALPPEPECRVLGPVINMDDTTMRALRLLITNARPMSGAEAVLLDLTAAWAWHKAGQVEETSVKDRKETLRRLANALEAAAEGDTKRYAQLAVPQGDHPPKLLGLPADPRGPIDLASAIPSELYLEVLSVLRRALGPDPKSRPYVPWHQLWPVVWPENFLEVAQAARTAIESAATNQPRGKQGASIARNLATAILVVLDAHGLSVSPGRGGLAAGIATYMTEDSGFDRLTDVLTGRPVRPPTAGKRGAVSESWERHLRWAWRHLLARKRTDPRALQRYLAELHMFQLMAGPILRSKRSGASEKVPARPSATRRR